MKTVRILVAVILEVFGALWLIVEITNYFVGSEVAKNIKDLWFLFLAAGVVISVIRLWPKRTYSFLIKDRDVEVKLIIGDIFKQEGPIVVGCNTTFDTSERIINAKSIQGQFTTKYFSSPAAIDRQIAAQIENIPCDIGTTATVEGESVTAYFCAISELNDSGSAQSTMQDLQKALGSLWHYLATSAEKSVINVPILGSGFSRISATRQDLFREIVLSFFAAISESTFCDEFRIIVYPKDIRKYDIDVSDLVKFLDHNCKYAISQPNTAGLGTAD